MTDGGQQFGKYRILEELGAGGFATVYKAVDTTLDREVALKILHPPLLTDRRFVQNFRQEARTLAALRHPQIITVYEVSEVDGRLFIAMDLAHGLSLAQSIAKRGHIPWDETLALLQPVCEALDYAHRQNVVHRDLKPANLLIDTQRGALLNDFGFARLMAENSASMSLSGGIVGTPGYIAPEVWENNATSPLVDIYAVGCIVYEMLTGDVLFKGQTPIQAMRAHDRGPQFPTTWTENVPTGITEVLGKALARDPATRYPSAGAMWHALDDLAAQAQARHQAEQSAKATKQEAARQVEETRREVEQRAAIVAQWRAEAERALSAKEWDAARIAVGRWRAVSPEDAAIGAILARLERLAVPPAEVQKKTSASLSNSQSTTAPATIATPVSQAPIRQKASSRRWLSWLLVITLLATLIGIIYFAMNMTLILAPAPTTGPPRWSDNFDSELTSHFTAETTESAVYKFIDGAYQITVTKPKLFRWRMMRDDYSDASISVDASIDGPSASAAGLIFHYQDANNFYIYSVDGKGHYKLDVYKDGKPITLVDWTASSSIRPFGLRNTLRVETNGVTIRLYANDMLLHVISDGTIEHGEAGLVVIAFDDPNVTGTFDNLVVLGL